MNTALSRNAGRPKLGREKYSVYLMYAMPGFLLYLFFFVSPIFLGVYYSTLDWNGYSKDYSFIGLQNYVKAFSNLKFKKAILFNLRYSIMLIIVVLVLGLVLALVLNKEFKGRTLVRSVFFMPAVLSMLTVSLIFNEIYFRALPAMGDLTGISFLSKNILSNKNTAIYGILFVHVWQGVAIPTVLLMAALQTVPVDIMEASAIDGATKWQQFWMITFPFLIPTIGVIMVLLLRDGLTLFDYVYGLTEGGPGGATRTITLLIYQQGFEEWKYSFAIAESIILAVILAGVSMLQIVFTQKKQVY